MDALIENFGIDWKILLIQVFNFVIVLVVFTFFVYKPLLKYITERKEKIEAGLIKEKEAERRFSEITNLEREKLKVAEIKASDVIANAQKMAELKGLEIIQKADEKGKETYQKAITEIEAEKELAVREAKAGVGKLVKEALVRFANMDPDSVDEALVKKAVEEVSRN